jgi:hypothetical protein
MMRRSRAYLMAVALLPLVVTAGAQPASAATAKCKAWFTPAPVDSSIGTLTGVSLVSANDGWAAGGNHVVRWNGASWRPVALPAPPAGQDQILAGIAARTSTDVWAVGETDSPTSPGKPLVLHWNGSSWSVPPMPRAVTGGLSAVSALTAKNVWAVGPKGGESALIMHWDGVSWTEVPNPSRHPLDDVDAVSATDVWAVGGFIRSVILHWDGTSWTSVSHQQHPNGFEILMGVKAVSATDVWAVGGSGYGGVSFHWDGKSWTRTDIATPLDDVAVVGPQDVYAVGDGGSARNPYRSEVWHFDGSQWTSEKPPKGTGPLLAVDALASGVVSAVGGLYPASEAFHVCPVLVADGGILGGGKANVPSFHVSFYNRNLASHSLLDASGLGLFDTGLHAPGSSAVISLPGAGHYVAQDAATGHTTTFDRTPDVSPRSGPASQTYQVSWGGHAGVVADVQVQRPGSSAWVWVVHGTTLTYAKFTPNAGPGTYRFRGLLRNASNTMTLGWSASSVLTVS